MKPEVSQSEKKKVGMPELLQVKTLWLNIQLA